MDDGPGRKSVYVETTVVSYLASRPFTGSTSC